MDKKEVGIMVCLILGLFLVVSLTGYRVVKSITYNIDIGDRLKRAADANQPELALEELTAALDEIDAWGLCADEDDCYTSVLYNTPDEDVGYWIKNLRQTQVDLKALPKDASHLEVSNTLMKVRETLLDRGQVVDVTEPEGISIAPNNVGIFWFTFIGLLLMTPFFYAVFKS